MGSVDEIAESLLALTDERGVDMFWDGQTVRVVTGNRIRLSGVGPSGEVERTESLRVWARLEVFDGGDIPALRDLVEILGTEFRVEAIHEVGHGILLMEVSRLA